MAINFYNGYVVDTATTDADLVRVSVPNLTIADRVVYGPLSFRPLIRQDGTVKLPSRGDKCVIAVDTENLGEQWISSWSGGHTISSLSPLVHTHPESDITGLVTDLAGKAPLVHTHAESDVTNLVTDLAARLTTANIQVFSSVGPTPVSWTVSVVGPIVVILVEMSGWNTTTGRPGGNPIFFGGSQVGGFDFFWNVANQHMVLPIQLIRLTGQTAGNKTLSVNSSGTTQTNDSNDFFRAIVFN